MGRKVKEGMDWQSCRGQWEAGQSSKKLCKLYPISRQAIDQMASKEGWTRVNRPKFNLPVITHFNAMLENTKASPQLIEIILKSFYDGNSQNVTAAISGITHQTLSNWRSNYPEFDSAVKKAQAQYAASMVGHMTRAAPRDWRAADRLLQVHELTKAEHLPQGHDQGKGAVNVVININRPPIEEARVIEHEAQDQTET